MKIAKSYSKNNNQSSSIWESSQRKERDGETLKANKLSAFVHSSNII